jgi:hypothetical protein
LGTQLPDELPLAGSERQFAHHRRTVVPEIHATIDMLKAPGQHALEALRQHDREDVRDETQHVLAAKLVAVFCIRRIRGGYTVVNIRPLCHHDLFIT